MSSKIFYTWVSLFLLLLEICIALYAPSHSFIRHSLGDYVVVILLFSAVKSVYNFPSFALAISVLSFSFLIEMSQYIHLIDRLHIQQPIIRIIMGNSFSLIDLILYFLGSLTIYLFDAYRYPQQKNIA